MLLIDSRERVKYEQFLPEQAGYIEYRQLDVGDIVLYDNTGTARVFVERKTLHDLMSSIQDGRFREQKIRLRAACSCGPQAFIVFLIEGVHAYGDGARNASISTALINLQLRDRFAVFNVSSTQAGAALLIELHKRLGALPRHSAPTPEDYTAVVRVKKADNISGSSSTACLQLAVIPGVSTRAARAILASFSSSSIADLCKQAADMSYDDLLEKLQLVRVNKRRVGPALAAKIAIGLGFTPT